MTLRRVGFGLTAFGVFAAAAWAQIPGSIRTVDPAAAAQDLFGDREDVFLAAGSAGAPCGRGVPVGRRLPLPGDRRDGGQAPVAGPGGRAAVHGQEWRDLFLRRHDARGGREDGLQLALHFAVAFRRRRLSQGGVPSTDTFLGHEAVPNGYRQTGPRDRRISKSLIAKDLGYTVVVCCLSFNGLDFGNQLMPGAIGGVVYEDQNANGARDPGEPPRRGGFLSRRSPVPRARTADSEQPFEDRHLTRS